MNNLKVLVVEDSDMVGKVLKHLVQQMLPYPPLYASTFAEARALVAAHRADIFAALVDLNLPDAPDGEVVDYVLGEKIPTIVLTGSYDEARREALFAKGIVDYITKEGRYAYSKAVGLVNRLTKNQSITVLVVDDSDVSRRHMVQLLKRHLFQVKEAKDGVEAIKVLLAHPEIHLLITDYNMPRMDGFELVKNLRYQYDKTDLVMIGVSGESNEALSAKFIKHGANDFLRKPFHPEEFYCRVIHNLESLEMIAQITWAAQRDHLTALYHRPHFFNAAREPFTQAKQNASPLSVVVMNIDNFSEVNHRFGSAEGDRLLQHVAAQLERLLGRFLIARADTDNFYALLPGLNGDKASALIATVRKLMAQEPWEIQGEPYYVSFSAGITDQLTDSLGEMIDYAKKLLAFAKDAGGNMTVDAES